MNLVFEQVYDRVDDQLWRLIGDGTTDPVGQHVYESLVELTLVQASDVVYSRIMGNQWASS